MTTEQAATIETIRERWADRSWPKIGYFVHGQALIDIRDLLEIIDALVAEGSAPTPRSLQR